MNAIAECTACNGTGKTLKSAMPGRFGGTCPKCGRKGALPKLTEKEFQSQVIKLARMRGWRIAHFRPARTESGWRTPVSGDGAGFPDLILLRRRRMIVAELKVGNNRPTNAQEQWLAAFADAGVQAFLWMPDMWDEIEAELA